MWYSRLQAVTDRIVLRELDSALGALPEWRLRKALSYRFDTDKYTCAKAYLMLKDMLEEHYGIFEDIEFAFGPHGKPYLKDYPDINFNISHCRRAVVCAVSDRPVGADVEILQFDDQIAAQAFSAAEMDAVRGSADPELAFTELWTRKESCLKLLGTGLTDDLKPLLADIGGKVEFHTSVDTGTRTVSTIALENKISEL